MAGVSDQEVTIARVYAKAMLDLAQERGEMDTLLAELTGLAAEVEKNPKLQAFMTSPMVDAPARARAIENLFRGKASELFVDSLQVLNRKGRLGLLRSVAEVYRLEHEDRRGRVEVHVRTAVPLTQKLRRRLKEALDAHTGRETDLVEAVDASLLGGVVVRVGDEKFDTSVATRLRGLGGALLERASHEIHTKRTYVEQSD
jgi:F-type H+-transporting ATPase subunit delta